MNIYVGNLAYSVTQEELREAFGAYGTVESATIITDRDTDRSKGFGFVEMPNNAEADAAIKALNDTQMNGFNSNRNVKVNQAKPRGDRPQRGGRGKGWWGRYPRFPPGAGMRPFRLSIPYIPLRQTTGPLLVTRGAIMGQIRYSTTPTRATPERWPSAQGSRMIIPAKTSPWSISESGWVGHLVPTSLEGVAKGSSRRVNGDKRG